ncbi:Eco57I restriction-modification methylase domain-containing protein [Corynebacterium suedekumii]|uniref:site-specific DNA-methyltransferase (adenine-specific) n=1 Tax=Corynebacterium suedekumii TaxID=3049801 RepID=A0ABY8VTW4_9CORY|nr:N-6 DNA methylase [Corynebacterium suedekumii]WIM71000.1 N-6 DNA methylase [Corynebacterium suedekumii]
MPELEALFEADTPALRKARGAFFTPEGISHFISTWAIRNATDRVMEPSAGDAAFMVAAVDRLKVLAGNPAAVPRIEGVEIHEHSATIGHERVVAAGGRPEITISDFFTVSPHPVYDAVIGNPPYIRYQDFSGVSRIRAAEAALKAGVRLSRLASSWAAFVIHSALFLKPGGRLGLVLPAELMSVNYAAPVRQFLFDNFANIQLVLFDEQVFPGVETDVVLLLADGYGQGPTTEATMRLTKNATSLASLSEESVSWTPPTASGKWTGSLAGAEALVALQALSAQEAFSGLQTWGKTTLGIVTGNNKYFALSPQRVKQVGLARSETLLLSPPGSAHLRGLELTTKQLQRLGQEGKSTRLFHPSEHHSEAAAAYIQAGHDTGVDTAYKCRVRKTWYQVPLIAPADLLLTCMNADTPRLTTNEAKAYHLNSVHGVYLADQYQELGRELLPLASLNSITLMHAEIVGRAYGGGVLKLEPREADIWLTPSPPWWTPTQTH